MKSNAFDFVLMAFQCRDAVQCGGVFRGIVRHPNRTRSIKTENNIFDLRIFEKLEKVNIFFFNLAAARRVPSALQATRRTVRA
jgi:hypothetical protein